MSGPITGVIHDVNPVITNAKGERAYAGFQDVFYEMAEDGKTGRAYIKDKTGQDIDVTHDVVVEKDGFGSALQFTAQTHLPLNGVVIDDENPDVIVVDHSRYDGETVVSKYYYPETPQFDAFKNQFSGALEHYVSITTGEFGKSGVGGGSGAFNQRIDTDNLSDEFIFEGGGKFVPMTANNYYGYEREANKDYNTQARLKLTLGADQAN